MTYEEWKKKYKPIANHIDLGNGYLFETYGPEHNYIKYKNQKSPKTIWTLIDTKDADKDVIVPGYHLVNRLGYFITEKEWTNQQLEIEY
jgi:hypothetical protein